MLRLSTSISAVISSLDRSLGRLVFAPKSPTPLQASENFHVHVVPYNEAEGEGSKGCSIIRPNEGVEIHVNMRQGLFLFHHRPTVTVSCRWSLLGMHYVERRHRRRLVEIWEKRTTVNASYGLVIGAS